MQAHAHGFDVAIEDLSDRTYMLALQGPEAQAILQKLTPADLATLPFHTGLETTVAGVPTVLGATGYTGEYGYELLFPVEQAVTIWNTLLEAGKEDGLLPCGLAAAANSLRFEPCLPLYGHEIDQETDPLSARLGWAVSFTRQLQLGRDALLKIKLEGPAKLLVGFEMADRGVPRPEYPVAVNGAVAGRVTTGMKSPHHRPLRRLAYVPASHARLGSEIDIMIHDRRRKRSWSSGRSMWRRTGGNDEV